MGNRLPSGGTGDFKVEVFSLADDNDGDDGDGGGSGDAGDGSSPVSVGQAVYTAAGEYAGAYNVTAAGGYTLHVRENVRRKHTYLFIDIIFFRVHTMLRGTPILLCSRMTIQPHKTHDHEHTTLARTHAPVPAIR